MTVLHGVLGSIPGRTVCIVSGRVLTAVLRTSVTIILCHNCLLSMLLPDSIAGSEDIILGYDSFSQRL